MFTLNITYVSSDYVETNNVRIYAGIPQILVNATCDSTDVYLILFNITGPVKL